MSELPTINIKPDEEVKLKAPKLKKEKPEKPEKKIKPEKREKKQRSYSFIDAYIEWRKQNLWTGLCPKKETSEYKEIRSLYDSKMKKSE